MGFLTGKTAIITGGGRAVLRMADVAPLGTELQLRMPKRGQILLLQEEMLRSSRTPKRSLKDYTGSRFWQFRQMYRQAQTMRQ